ncbi:unnamed protein product [Symbiodinium sp. CCMP2592]|nr:unnamed protein product [Symbiodinium sp. CCMP2592]
MSLSDILKAEGLSEALIKVATDAGWTLSTFRHAADSPADLEKVLPEIFGSSELSRLQIAQVRAAWAGLSSSASSAPPAVPASASDTSSWVETFAPKITALKLTEYKKAFLAAYTSEILSPCSMPSLRLVSLAAHQESKKDYKWIPWKHRMSEEKAAELQLSRPAKQPRLEALGISSLLLDEPPTLEVGDNFMGVSAVQRILAIHDVALAMVGSCHLARLKAYSSKFIHLLSQRHEASSGLRAPTILEAQQADCKLWQGIYALVLEKDWSLNDAIFEYTEIRGDMSNLLQARARPPPPLRFNEKGIKGKGLGRFMSEAWKGHSFEGKGKSPGKEKGSKGKPSGKGGAAPGESFPGVVPLLGTASEHPAPNDPHLAGVRQAPASLHNMPNGALQVPATSVASASEVHVHDYASCLALLQSACWPPPSAQSRSVVSANSVSSGYWNFGCQVSDRTALTRVSRALPAVCKALNKFLRLQFPTESWNSLCVAKNVVTSAHRDTANVLGSFNLSVSLGSFTGGSLWLEDASGDHLRFIPTLNSQLKGKLLCTKENPIKFPAHSWHMTEPFCGERWVLTAFTMANCDNALLGPLEFPISQSVSQASSVRPVMTQRAEPLSAASGNTVNWGQPSAFGFRHHSLRPPVPAPAPRSPSHALDALANIPQRFFLDICSGVTKPLSCAVEACGLATLSIDILLDPAFDLLQDDFFEQLLFICGSGAVGYCAAAPSCSHYSRLKLSGGPPFPIRTPEHLDGVPGLGPSDLAKLQESHEILSRCCKCVSIVYSAGGHGHIEQPPGAMSWEESCLQSWLHECSASMIWVAACGYGLPWKKSWLFASSFAPLRNMGCVCEHGRDAHPVMRGLDNSGLFKSRQTAQYPEALATTFAAQIQVLLAKSGPALTLRDALTLVPCKPMDQLPHAVHDGAGRHSHADWSAPCAPDLLRNLRSFLLKATASMSGPSRLLQRRYEPSKEPLFSASEVARVREGFFSALGIPAPANAWLQRAHQPLALNALEAVARVCLDADTTLFPSLKAGVPTGFQSDIPPSHSFWPNIRESLDDIPLSIHLQNWRSATVEPAVTRRLLQEELDQGFCFRFQGSLADAQQRWPLGVALGKLAVVRAPGRSERLCLDNSVCGTNANCSVPEKQHMPSARDVLHSYPLRECSQIQGALSIDIKSAHKRCVVKDAEQGLLGFTCEEPDGSNALYFYRTCPFGATFAQHWWGRLGSCILRILHILIYIAHTGHLFVDDYLFSQEMSILPATGAMICMFMQIMGVPLSWHKLQIAVRVTWIGWDFQYSAGIVLLKESKRLKLLGMVQDLRQNPRLTKKDLERFIGLALWATSLFPVMKSMLHTFYHDLYSPAATNYSIPPERWHEIARYLSQDLHFTVTPPGTGIPIGSKMLSARHQDLHSLQDLEKVRVSDRRLWIRVSSQHSKKRKLSLNSLRILGLLEHWLLHMSPFRSMRQPATPLFDARADASAKGSHCCIGGYVRHPSLGHRWFQQTFAHADFLALGIGVQADMAREISCYEALAQAALILAASALLPCSCIPITLRALSDNTGAEAGVNDSLTTSQPLCFFLERISLLAAVHRITPDVSHIPGEANDKADALSRPQEHPLPHDCLQHERISATLQDLWLPRPMISVSPSSVQLPWQIRSRGDPGHENTNDIEHPEENQTLGSTVAEDPGHQNTNDSEHPEENQTLGSTFAEDPGHQNTNDMLAEENHQEETLGSRVAEDGEASGAGGEDSQPSNGDGSDDSSYEQVVDGENREYWEAELKKAKDTLEFWRCKKFYAKSCLSKFKSRSRSRGPPMNFDSQCDPCWSTQTSAGIAILAGYPASETCAVGVEWACVCISAEIPEALHATLCVGYGTAQLLGFGVCGLFRAAMDTGEDSQVFIEPEKADPKEAREVVVVTAPVDVLHGSNTKEVFSDSQEVIREPKNKKPRTSEKKTDED